MKSHLSIPRRTRAPRRAPLALAVLLSVSNTPLAQGNEVIQNYEVPAASLADALNQFGQEAGILLSFDALLVEGLNSPGLDGEYSIVEGLETLLGNSGLRVVVSEDGSYRIEGGHEATKKDQRSVDPMAFETVVVQGELQERSVQDSQTSVAVITGSELESRSDVDLYGVVQRTPGIVSAFGDKGFVIRGIDQRGVGGGGSGLTVSTTVDGATISNSNQLTFFGPYSTWDLEQIEILRGPQSTQTGRNALAGAVVIRSKDPVYYQEAKLRGDFAERSTLGAAAAFNLPLIEEKLAIRLSAEGYETDGLVENPTLGIDDYDARKKETYRAAIRFDPTENFDGVFKWTHSRNFGGEDFVEYESFPEERLNFSNVIANEGVSMDSYNLRLGYNFSPTLRLESETTYFDADYSRIEDSDQSPIDTGTLGRSSEVTNLQQELKLLLNIERLNAVLGVFYTDVSDDAPAGGTFPAAVLNPAFEGRGTITALINRDQETENTALFGEAEYALTSALTLIAGFRYDREESTTVTVNSFTATDPLVGSFLPPPSTETQDADFDAFLPKAGLVYAFQEDLSLGFVIQQGYRAGGVQVNPATGQRNEFDPEYTWNYEASLRSQWLDRLITMNANVFYTDWEDQQVDVLGDSGNPVDIDTLNAGTSSLYGGEIEFRARPNNWDIYTSLAYVKTQFDDFTSGEDDFSGNEFPYAPRLTATAGATRFFSNGTYLNVDGNYTGSTYVDASNTNFTKTPSRTVYNAQFGYEAASWQVFAYARNLFDKAYYTQAVGTNGEIERVRPGEPRTLGIAGQVYF